MRKALFFCPVVLLIVAMRGIFIANSQMTIRKTNVK